MPGEVLWPGTREDEPDYRPAHPKPAKTPRAQAQQIQAKGQSESSRLEDVADRLFYRELLKRHNATCEASGEGADPDGSPVRCRGRLDPAHGFSRRHHSTRWAHAGVHLLCRAHHDWFQARPSEWYRWRVSKLGVWLFEAVQRLANTTWRGSLADVVADLRVGRTQLEREGT